MFQKQAEDLAYGLLPKAGLEGLPRRLADDWAVDVYHPTNPGSVTPLRVLPATLADLNALLAAHPAILPEPVAAEARRTSGRRNGRRR